MYARGIDAINWKLDRPEALSRALTRRAVTWSAVILVAVFGFSKVVQGGTAPGYTTIRVGQGQTVWAIAADRYPDADARVKVNEILQANGLKQPLVYPGERLKVPNQ